MRDLPTAAMQYALDDWPIFPCEEAGKQPLTRHGVKDATTDIDTVREWWRKWPRANIAVAMGPRAGVVAVDLDGPAGRASFDQIVQMRGGVPDTLQSVTGNGRHLLFVAPDGEFKNSQSKLGPGIDTRGDGGYIIVEPSVHPSGALYEWAEPRHAPAPLPAWLNPASVKPKKVERRAPRMVSDNDDLARRASLYLACMPAAVEGGGGHSSLYAAATALVHGFRMSPSDAEDMLASEYNPRCSPPWDLSDPKDAKDFRRKVDQARSQPHDQPLGYLADEGMADEGDVAMGEASAKAILANLGRGDIQALPAAPSPPAVVPLPAHLLQPAGLVGRLAGWINSTAIMPQPELVLGASLAFVGALVGRKVKAPNDLRTNLYVLGVADSGSGKDHARKAIKRLCTAAGVVGEVLGGEEVSSDAAIYSAVERMPSLLFLLDEVGHFIASTSDRGAASYAKAIPATFTKLFSSASTMMLGREYAGERERKDYDQPNVCLYGSTVPGTLYRGLTPDDITNGFVSRMLVVASSDPDPDPRDLGPTQPPPADLVEAVKAWAAYKPEAPEGVGNIAAIAQVWPEAAQVEPEAESIMRAFRETCREHKRAVRGDRGLDALWARGAEHAWKVALVMGCGEAGEPVIIDAPVARHAVDLVERLVRGLVVSVQDHVSDSRYGSDQLRVMRAVKQLGSATLTQIGRKTQDMDPKTRASVIHGLVELDLLSVSKSDNKRGKQVSVYRAVEEAA